MSDPNAFTRREFLHSTLAMVSVAATVPTFLHQSAVALGDPLDSPLVKNKPGVPDERILVVIQLSGGNDGINTVIPFGDDQYYKARPQIAIAKPQVLTLDKQSGVGLHPQMNDLKAMIDEGLAGVVLGVGYPNPNRSHFASMDIWHTADLDGGRGTGWVGRTADQLTAGEQHPDPMSCICLGQTTELAVRGARVTPMTFEQPNQLKWTGGDLHPAVAEQYTKLNMAGVVDPKLVREGSQAAFVMRTALDAQLAPQRIRDAISKGTITSFPGNRLAQQLRMVASMIRAELPTRVYYVGMGGFDTHAGQPQSHGRLLGEFSSAVRAFQKELVATRQQSRVLTLAFSEFGRRVRQNASNGTDHGTAGPVFLFGDMVKPGLLGKYPSLAQLDEGDLIYNVDFRNVYAGVLDGWMKLDSRKVLGKAFQPAVVLNKART